MVFINNSLQIYQKWPIPKINRLAEDKFINPANYKK